MWIAYSTIYSLEYMVKPVEKYEEKHQVCDDFNKARAVLESFALKLDAFPVDLHRKMISLSDSADKKHSELLDTQ